MFKRLHKRKNKCSNGWVKLFLMTDEDNLTSRKYMEDRLSPEIAQQYWLHLFPSRRLIDPSLTTLIYTPCTQLRLECSSSLTCCSIFLLLLFVFCEAALLIAAREPSVSCTHWDRISSLNQEPAILLCSLSCFITAGRKPVFPNSLTVTWMSSPWFLLGSHRGINRSWKLLLPL